MRTKKIDCG